MTNDIPDHSGLPGDKWIPLRWPDGRGIAARLDSASGATVVRHFEPGWEFVMPESPLDQAISLCTPVSWWTRALREGWHTLGHESPNLAADATRYPMDWRLADLM